MNMLVMALRMLPKAMLMLVLLMMAVAILNVNVNIQLLIITRCARWRWRRSDIPSWRIDVAILRLPWRRRCALLCLDTEVDRDGHGNLDWHRHRHADGDRNVAIPLNDGFLFTGLGSPATVARSWRRGVHVDGDDINRLWLWLRETWWWAWYRLWRADDYRCRFWLNGGRR